MSAVCILTPMVVASWPALSTAVLGAASALGFALSSQEGAPSRRGHAETEVELEVPNSEVIEDGLDPSRTLEVVRDGVRVTVGVDSRGACRVWVHGQGRSEAELRQVGETLVGAIVQQFAYHKLMTAIKERRYHVVEQAREEDDTIRIRVRL